MQGQGGGVISPPNRKEKNMTRDDLITSLEELLETIKDYGAPDGMTDEAYFDVVIELETAIDKAIENGEE